MKKFTLISISVMCGFMLTSQAQQFIKLDTSFYSEALGEQRMVDVYLPKDYYQNPDQHYAVIYYLHGAGGNQNSGNLEAYHYYTQHYLDSATITSPPAIYVCPDGSCSPYLGSMYVNSDLYGNFEDFIMQDVIAFTETSFRVMPGKEFRFITGLSMGGFGSAWLAATFPDLFRAAFPYIGFLAWPDTTWNTWKNYVFLENGSYHLNYNAGSYTNLLFTGCGGFSPNMDLPPYYIELPIDTLGNWVDSVLAKWELFNVSRKVKNLPDHNELSWFLGCGTLDPMITYPTYQVFMDSMDAYEVEYDSKFFNGGHVLNIQAWKAGMHWMDSIINLSFQPIPGFEETTDRDIACSVYPNPATESITLSVSLSEPSTVSVDLHTVSGTPVLSRHTGSLPAGINTIHLDLRHLPSGIYFIRLKAGDQAVVKRVVKW